MKRLWLLLAVLLVLAAGCGPKAPAAPATSAAGGAEGAPDARRQLAELVVGARGTMDGYSREQYPHWSSHPESCNTRELVLKRDGKDVQAGKDCNPTAGSWFSLYDGDTWTKPSDVDIDHMVPLGHSWISGARSWTKERRGEFANDLVRPQLFAVTDNVNQQKSDKPPDEWKPPLVSYWCTYAGDWIEVKHFYQLTITERERSALTLMLDKC